MAISLDNTYLTNYSAEVADSSASRLTTMIQDADTDDEVMEACEQFEAYMIQQIFKNMQETAKIFSDDDEEEDSTSSQYLDVFNDTYLEDIANTMMDNGQSLGLAKQLYDSIQMNSGATAAVDTATDTGTE